MSNEIHVLKKPSDYYSGARKGFMDFLPDNPAAKLLEVGCGNGDTAAFAKVAGKCGWAAGVELCQVPAEEAATKLDQVCIGDIEHMDLPFPEQYFDVLIMSEVVEHFRDPWRVLKRLRTYMKPGAIVVSGSPNVCYHEVIRMLLAGRWDYEASGIMDKTHLRWFTRETYNELFEESGFSVVQSGRANRLSKGEKWLNRLSFGKFEHLFTKQIYVVARISA